MTIRHSPKVTIYAGVSPDPIPISRQPGAWPLKLLLVGLFSVYLAGTYRIAEIDIRLLGIAFLTLGLLVVLPMPVERKQTLSASSWFSVFFLAWLATLSAASFWSPSMARVDTNLVDVLALTLIFTYTRIYLGRMPLRSLLWLWWFCLISSVIFATFALINDTVGAQGRLAAFGGGPNVFARTVGLGIIGSLCLLSLYPRRSLLLLPLPLLIIAAALSGSRGAVLAILAACTYVLFLTHRSVRAWSTIVTLSLVTIAAAFVTPLPKSWIELVRDRFVVYTLQERYLAGRDQILVETIRLIREHPLAGVGLDGYWGSIGHQQGSQHPHNLFLQTWAEGGLLSFLLLLASCTLGFWCSFQARSLLGRTAPAGAILILFATMFSGTWYDSRFLWLFLVFGVEFYSRELRGDCIEPEP